MILSRCHPVALALSFCCAVVLLRWSCYSATVSFCSAVIMLCCRCYFVALSLSFCRSIGLLGILLLCCCLTLSYIHTISHPLTPMLPLSHAVTLSRLPVAPASVSTSTSTSTVPDRSFNNCCLARHDGSIFHLPGSRPPSKFRDLFGDLLYSLIK